MAKRNVWEYNWAKDHKIRDRISEYFVPKMRSTRDARIVLEEAWMRFFNMWNVTKDSYHQYMGRAQLYVPEVRKSVESQARNFTAAAFPDDDFFDCVAGPTGTASGAKLNKQVRQWQLEQCKLRTKYHVFSRQAALYGTSPVYIPWRKETQTAFRSAKVKGKIQPAKSQIEIFNGPDFVVKDLFKFFFLDPTQMDINESGCFEHSVVNYYDLVKKQAAGMLVGIDEIEQGPSDGFATEELYRDIQRFESQGILITGQGYSGEAIFRKDQDKNRGTHLCSTIFVKAELPDACDEGEDPQQPIPLMIEIYDHEHVGLIRRNPFWHQRVPYLIGRYIHPNCNEAYGQGIPWAVQYMQYELNAKAEQSLDSATLANNPIAIVDPGLAAQSNEFPMEPGSIWWASPSGIKLTSIPDTSKVGYETMNIIKGYMQDYSDRNPTLPSQLSGKSRTATQSTDVTQAMGVDTTAFQKQMEIEVLEPMMEMWESLTDQNESEDQMIMIAGSRITDWKNKLVTKDQTLGSYRYFWKVSSQVQNRQVLSRQMMDAIRVATMVKQVDPQFPFNFAEAYGLLYKQGWALPDSEKILGDPSDVEPQDPKHERRMAELGMNIDVAPEDDDQGHMQQHDLDIQQSKDPHVKNSLAIHNLQHQAQFQKKQQAAQMQAQQQQMMMQQQQQQQQKGGKQRGNAHMSGNRTELSGNNSSGDIASGQKL